MGRVDREWIHNAFRAHAGAAAVNTFALERNLCRPAVQVPVQLDGGFVADAIEAVAVPGHVLPVIGHDGGAQHRGRTGRHEQRQEEEHDRWRYRAARPIAGRCLLMIRCGSSGTGRRRRRAARTRTGRGHDGGGRRRWLHAGAVVLIVVAAVNAGRLVRRWWVVVAAR